MVDRRLGAPGSSDSASRVGHRCHEGDDRGVVGQSSCKPAAGMAQLFSRAASVRLNLTLLIVLVVLPAAGCVVWWLLYHSPLRTRRGVEIEQPIPFSHKHHAGELGIDCRYCHDAVERSAFAGIPSVHTCMSCHSQVWKTAAMLEPVRA